LTERNSVLMKMMYLALAGCIAFGYCR